jgi:serine/threonine protein kinase
MTTPQDRYEFLETLGTGATSRVDKARDTVIGRTVAMKTFLHGFGSSDVQKQFLREAQIIGRLAHPFIVGLYDVGTDSNGVPYFVMEYVEGKTLERVLDDGPLPLQKAAVWAADLSAALSRAHRAKVIHGDIKPANVMITRDGQVKLGDFGIARFATQVSTSGALMGTPAYLSPEQIQGQTQDTRSDLFSLGIILYQMTTGVRPFNGTSVSAVCAQIVAIDPPPPSQHNPSLPAEFDRIVMRCLAKNPAERYATAEALGASLYPLARGQEGFAEKPTSSFSMAAFTQSAQALMAKARKSITGAVESATHNFGEAAAATSIWADSWSNGKIQSKEMLAIGTGALVVLSLVPIARALRNYSHAAPATVAATSGSGFVTSPAAGNSSKAPINSNASMINVSATSPGGGLVETSRPASTSVMTATPAFERHAAATPKSEGLKGSNAMAVPAPKAAVTVYGPPALLDEPVETVVAAAEIVPQATLNIRVLTATSDQTLAIFSGTELLVTTELHPAHPGDTLKFSCPITPGEHALKVVLYRGDKTILMHKERNSALRAEGANNMEIRVNRRAKMLVKHETSLEVVWPSSADSSTEVANPDFKPAGSLSLR